MDWLEFIEKILETCIIPLLGALVTYLVTYIRRKIEAEKQETSNKKVQQYLSILEKTIDDCVKTTNQTLVEALKKENRFDSEAQREALEKTLTAVWDVVSEDMIECLETVFDDLELYVKNKIEAKVNENKK